MVHFALVKIIKNKLIFGILIIGVMFSVISACVIPMFSSALQSRLLFMSFNDKAFKTGRYSNTLSYSLNYAGKNDFGKYATKVENDYMQQFKQPIVYFNKIYSTIIIDAKDITYETKEPEFLQLSFMSMNNYENNIKLLDGRYPSSKPDASGYMEIIVSNDTAKQSEMAVGRIYEAYVDDIEFNFKVTGIFTPYVGGTSFLDNPDDISFTAICDASLFKEKFIDENYLLKSAKWDYMFDFYSIDINNFSSIFRSYNDQVIELADNADGFEMSYPGVEIIHDFAKSNHNLILMLMIYTIPMFCLLLYCIFFISKLIVEIDKDEISVLQSRGASKLDMLRIYVIQSLAIITIPLISGPFIALYVSRLLGNTIGFLEYGNNLPLNTKISLIVISSDIIICIIAALTMLIPSFLLFRIGIVERKLINSEKPHKPIWKKIYFDFVLIAVSGYGYYNFAVRQKTISAEVLTTDKVPIEPLTYLIMLMFVFGCGLLFIRLYPFILKLVSEAGRRIWGAAIYSSLQRARVLREKEQFVVILIIISISLSLFSANSARTINTNLDDYIMYNGGTDLLIKPVPLNVKAMETGEKEKKPDIAIYQNLKGVTDLSLVSYANLPSIYAKMQLNKNPVKVMGIDTKSYQAVAWARTDMMDKPLPDYLSLLGKSENNCFITETIAKEMNLKVGDEVEINIYEAFDAFYVKIVAIVKAWPGYSYKQDDKGEMIIEDMMILNSDFLNDKYKNVTYEIWAKTDGGLSSSTITDQMSQKNIDTYFIKDYVNDVYISRNSADRISLNSLISYSFIVILIMCFIAFALYWVLSVKSRAMQFGTLRAMGMSSFSVYMMLIWEQFFISIISAFYAVYLGFISSRIFVDILKVTFGADKQIIPFKFFTQQNDYVKIGVFFLAIFIFTLVLMFMIVRRVKISQAIKFGEG
ncbi:MAG: ABC transporter permease [Saccharofermentanales bacterium]